MSTFQISFRAADAPCDIGRLGEQGLERGHMPAHGGRGCCGWWASASALGGSPCWRPRGMQKPCRRPHAPAPAPVCPLPCAARRRTGPPTPRRLVRQAPPARMTAFLQQAARFDTKITHGCQGDAQVAVNKAAPPPEAMVSNTGSLVPGDSRDLFAFCRASFSCAAHSRPSACL